MSYSLSKSGAHKTVGTLEQANGLIANGWILASGGSAGDTTTLHEFPFNVESVTDDINPMHRGVGISGEDTGVLGYVVKKSMANLNTTDEVEAIQDAFYNDESKTASTFTDIEVVTELPSEPSETKIYLLSQTDGEYSPGNYISNAGHWIAYTPGDTFDVNYGADVELAKILDTALATLPAGTENTKAGVEAAILALAAAIEGFDSTNYAVTVATSPSSTYTGGVWGGKLKVTHKTNSANTSTDASARSITITISS